MDIPSILKPYLSRVIGTLIAGFIAWLAGKNINVDGDTAQQATAAIVGLALGVFGLLYGFLHKIFDKIFNPSDSAAQANIAHGEVVKKQAE